MSKKKRVSLSAPARPASPKKPLLGNIRDGEPRKPNQLREKDGRFGGSLSLAQKKNNIPKVSSTLQTKDMPLPLNKETKLTTSNY